MVFQNWNIIPKKKIKFFIIHSNVMWCSTFDKKKLNFRAKPYFFIKKARVVLKVFHNYGLKYHGFGSKSFLFSFLLFF